MTFQRNDVVLVPFPFSDLSATKVRPAVIVSSALYHSTEPDLLLAALTSKIAAATGPFDYVLNDWQTAGLRYPSAFKPVIFTLDPARILHRIGTLTPVDVAQVDQLSFEERDESGSWRRSISVTDQRLYVAGPSWGTNGPVGSTIQVVDISDPNGDLKLGG